MAQDVDVQRMLRQLDGDITAIYEMVSTISATQQEHGEVSIAA